MTTEMRCNMTFFDMWCHLHWHWCHSIPTVPSMVPLHFLGKMIIKKCNMAFLVMWCHWHQHWCHLMLMVSSMVPLHSSYQDDWNEVQHDFWSCDPLVPVLGPHDFNKMINNITALLRSRWSKWDRTLFLWSCDATGAGVGIMLYQWHHQWHHCTP